MTENNGDGRVRARVRVTHVYLSEGLVEEAEAELALLLDELGIAVEATAAKSNGGGRREEPATAPREWGNGAHRAAKARKAKKTRKAAVPKPEAPSRPSPEQEARAVAESRGTTLVVDLPAPVGEGRSARSFTVEERAAVIAYAREHTIPRAQEVFNLSWATVRDWMERSS